MGCIRACSHHKDNPYDALLEAVTSGTPPPIGSLTKFSQIEDKFEGILRLCWGDFDIVYDVHVAGWCWRFGWITFECFAKVYRYWCIGVTITCDITLWLLSYLVHFYMG